MLYSLFFQHLELFLLILLLFWLHWSRRNLGHLPLLLLFTIFFLFSQIILLPELNEVLNYQDFQGILTRNFLFIPIILTYLLLYEERGVQATRKFILALCISSIATPYLISLLMGQFNDNETAKNAPGILTILQNDSAFLHPFLQLAFLHLSLLTLLSVPYQFLRNHRFPMSVSAFFTLEILLFCSAGIQCWKADYPVLWNLPISAWCISTLLIALICGALECYLRLIGKGDPIPRNPWGILSAMLLHLQSSSEMRRSLDDWSNRYQIIFDNTLEMIFLLNWNGNVLNANRAAQNCLGNFLTAKDFRLPDILLHETDSSPVDWETAYKTVWDADDSDSDVHPSITKSNLYLTLPDGSKRYVELTLTGAQVLGEHQVLLFLHDITKRRQQEEAHKKLEEQLVHAQRMEEMGTLAGGIAHDFNNLLHGIQGGLDLIKQEPLGSDALGILEHIHGTTKRAADLTSKLLGFARKGAYNPQKLNLQNVLRKAAELFQIGHQEVTFRLLLPPIPLFIEGDDVQLQQVFLNLLLNAKDAIPPGPVSQRLITLRLDQASASSPQWASHPADAAVAKNYALIRVRDNGSGMTPEVQQHLFDPFFTTKGPRGTGLGLSMAYSCVSRLHGWFHIDSRQGKGTEISIFLPLIPNTL